MHPEKAIAAEQGLVGGVLLDGKAYARVAGMVEQSYLARPAHRIIWAAYERLSARRIEPNYLTVIDELKRVRSLEEAGGWAYLSELRRDTPTTANIEGFAAAVRARAMIGQVEVIGRQIAQAAADGDNPDEVIAGAIDRLVQIQTGNRGAQGAVPAEQALQEFIEILDARKHGQRGLMLGLPDFDAVSKGLQPGQLVVIGGRPGTGKTSVLLNVASNVSPAAPVLVFEAEMGRDELMEQAVALHGRVSRGRLQDGDLTADEWEKVGDAQTSVSDLKLWIDDRPSPPLSHVRAESYAIQARHGLSLVIVDYTQLVKGTSKILRENVDEVIYGLKALAKELRVPVIALAQLSRGVESRDDKRPRVPDLKESGGIEQAADLIVLLYRQFCYDRQFSMPQVLEWELAKNRRGQVGAGLWCFQGDYARICQLEDGPAAQYRHLLARDARSGANDDI